MTKPYAVYADRYGRIREEPGLTALGANGENWVEMEELIPLPPGSDLFFLPRRRPVGRNIITGKVEVMAGKDRAAVAAGLPPGYTRLLLPAYRSLPGAPVFLYLAIRRWLRLMAVFLRPPAGPTGRRGGNRRPITPRTCRFWWKKKQPPAPATGS